MPDELPLELNSYEDFLTLFDAQAALCLLCRLTAVEVQYTLRLGKNSHRDADATVVIAPDNATQLTVQAVAFNCFENFPVELIFFGGGKVEEDEALHERLLDMISAQRAVVVTASVYYFIDGDLALFSPSLASTTARASQLGLSKVAGSSH